jgi:pyrimidine operon attenuation protein/uracil phosphoribosyltransferase
MTSDVPRQDRIRGLAFFAKSQLLSGDDVARAMKRMAHEIIERNHGVGELLLVGLQRGGIPVAQKLGELLHDISGEPVEVASLDVSFYRDDIDANPLIESSLTTLSGDVANRTVVLVDDVLFTGRTIRAALQAINDWGRPAAVQLAVLVDRGHRELPIRPDFVGKNLPTARTELVRATLEGVWLGTRGEQ